MDPSHWLGRYRAGHEPEVWIDIAAAGALPLDDDKAEHVRLVCDEMARRARWNVEVIIERLTAQGYRFHTNDDRQDPVAALLPPGARASEVGNWLLANFSVVPPTILSWLRIVGDVWLVGSHPLWPGSAAADPLVVELEGSRYSDASIIDYYAEELEAAQEAEVPFELPVAPDHFHKDNVSGGAPYGFVLPDSAADATFVHQQTESFVSYLNRAFRNGGFPGPDGTPDAQRIRTTLAEGLVRL